MSQDPTHSRPLNVVADQLSRLSQTIHPEWALLREVFQSLCTKWHQSQKDLFATSFNNKLPQFVSPASDPLAWAVDALSLPWEDLVPYVFKPVAILGKVVSRQGTTLAGESFRLFQGGPTCPGFVAISRQIPLFLPNLLTPPFRPISVLNLNVFYLEPQPSRSNASDTVTA